MDCPTRRTRLMPTVQDLGGGKWRIRVFLSEDPKTGKQKRKTVTFRAQGVKAARLEAQRLTDQIREVGPGIDTTVADAAEIWWGIWSARGRSPSTAQGYRGIVDQHVKGGALGRRRVVDVKVGDVDRWYVALHQGGLSVARVRRIHAVLSQIFEQCHRDELVSRNVAKVAQLPDEHAKPRDMPRTDVIVRILDAAWANHEVRGRALTFAALTGLRRGELAAVRWSRLDLDRATLLVDAAVIGIEGETILKDPKAHAAETITLNDQAVDIARAQIEWQTAQLESAHGAGDIDELFLWSVAPPFAAPLWPDTFSGWWSAARAEVGPDAAGVRLHDARHYHASVLIDAGASVADVQLRLRHQSISTTMKYVHANHERQRALDALTPYLPVGGSTAPTTEPPYTDSRPRLRLVQPPTDAPDDEVAAAG